MVPDAVLNLLMIRSHLFWRAETPILGKGITYTGLLDHQNRIYVDS